MCGGGGYTIKDLKDLLFSFPKKKKKKYQMFLLDMQKQCRETAASLLSPDINASSEWTVFIDHVFILLKY